MTTDYSGMGCAELAGKMLEASAMMEGMSVGEGITCYRSSDIDEDHDLECMCGAVLSSIAVGVVCVSCCGDMSLKSSWACVFFRP